MFESFSVHHSIDVQRIFCLWTASKLFASDYVAYKSKRLDNRRSGVWNNSLSYGIQEEGT